MATNITYNGFDFSEQGPVPFLSITDQIRYDSGGNKIGATSQITLDGTLTPLPNQGYILIDELQDNLREAFSVPGRLVITCDSETLMDVYARPTNINLPPSNNNWTQTSPFSITLDFESEPIVSGIYVSDVSESWTIQVDETNSLYNWDFSTTGDRNSTVLNITHELSAQGLPVYVDDPLATGAMLARPAWQQARDWVVSQLGVQSSDLNSSGVISLNGTKFANLNHIRVEQKNERQGSFSVTETWVGLDNTVAGIGGSGIEDFTVSVDESNENGLTSVTVQGSIQGLEVRNMDGGTGSFNVSVTKYETASGFWNNVQPKIYNRAKLASGKSNLNFNPLSYSVGHSPTKGTISYRYSYDTRPCNLIENALFENIEITDIYPTDVFASIAVLGRAKGPILQSIGTITEAKRAVNIDIVVQPPTGCSFSGWMAANPEPEVNEFLRVVQNDLSGQQHQMFLSANQGVWNPKTGRYTRTAEWTYAGCSGDFYSTTF